MLNDSAFPGRGRSAVAGSSLLLSTYEVLLAVRRLSKHPLKYDAVLSNGLSWDYIVRTLSRNAGAAVEKCAESYG